MRLKINGQNADIQTGIITLSDYLESRRINPDLVAVEVNLSVVTKKDYPILELKEGDEIEIVNFVGGGA